MTQVECAARCGTMMDKVDGHAAGWRPLCRPCFKKELSWWFGTIEFSEPLKVREPLIETFGKKPQGEGYLLPKSIVRKVLKHGVSYRDSSAACVAGWRPTNVGSPGIRK